MFYEKDQVILGKINKKVESGQGGNIQEKFVDSSIVYEYDVPG